MKNRNDQNSKLTAQDLEARRPHPSTYLSKLKLDLVNNKQWCQARDRAMKSLKERNYLKK